ncbi:ABC transporter substrate-binding protein [Allosalinactinospora lopnorensis]|uniref:ABC transporter substrate-binding protein n=1 Tax=Allosalinactinospora lopnorensis TaxID=1352348 RepID=UPI000623C087|nr:ABC transporter substrate-binding protein [Allosalinactinospora lopnorensis]
MRRSTPLLASLTLVVAMTACEGSAGDDDSIPVGYITPLTGAFSNLGEDNQKAVEAAVDEINTDGGVLGRPIELITQNDESNPDQGILAFNEIMNDEPVAVIGSASSNSAMAVLEHVEREQVPYISPTPADEQVAPVRDHVFVVPAIAGTYAERALHYLSDEGMDEVAVTYSETAYGEAGYEAMVEGADEHGVDLVVEEAFEQETTDFGHILAEIESVGPDATIVWASGPPGITIAEQYAGADIEAPLVMTGSQASHLWTDPAGDSAEGVTVLSSIGVVGEHLPEGEQQDVIREMTEVFEAEHGYAPPQFAQDGYTAVMLLAAAIEEAGSTERADIRDALENLTLTTPNGTFDYSETDHAGLTGDAISVNVVEDGEFVPTDWSTERFGETYGEE